MLYLAFVPFCVLCSTNLACFVLMCFTGVASVFLDIYLVVERKVALQDKARAQAVSIGSPLMTEVIIVLRVLMTTLVPILMASFGGASFLATTELGSLKQGCVVAELPKLAQEGYVRFACSDGYVPDELQLAIPAWQARRPGDRRLEALGEGAVGEEADGAAHTRALTEIIGGSRDGVRYGYVAPVFPSHEAYHAGVEPVAWAAKAGSPVRPSVCNSGDRGTCGIFASALQAPWSAWPAPKGFGQAWGFNITRFTEAEMREAVRVARARWPEKHLGKDPVALVIAEDTQQYFGIAYPLLWVAMTLLAVGLVDRLAVLFEPGEEDEASSAGYDVMLFRSEREEQQPGMWDNVTSFWSDPLNSNKLRVLTETLHVAPEGAGTSPRALRRGTPPPVLGLPPDGDFTRGSPSALRQLY